MRAKTSSQYEEIIKHLRTSMNKYCALCECEFDDSNNSKEHIIPRALGGRKKVEWFICGSCNNETGEAWDAPLIKMFQYYCLRLDVKTQGKNTPPMPFTTKDGDKMKLFLDGSIKSAAPLVDVSRDEEGYKVHIEANSAKEAKNIANNVAKSIAKKHPQIDMPCLDDIYSQFNDVPGYVNSALDLNFSFGDIEKDKSLVKTATAFAVGSGIGIDECDFALECLLSDSTVACIGPYYERHKDAVLNRKDNKLFHCVYIKGDARKGVLYCYIEYFSFYRVIVSLSNKYSGKDVDYQYAINPSEWKQIDLDICLSLSKDDIRQACDYKKICTETLSFSNNQINALAQYPQILK